MNFVFLHIIYMTCGTKFYSYIFIYTMIYFYNIYTYASDISTLQYLFLIAYVSQPLYALPIQHTKIIIINENVRGTLFDSMEVSLCYILNIFNSTSKVLMVLCFFFLIQIKRFLVLIMVCFLNW